MVDVQSAARTEVINRDTLDALPTPRNTQSIGYLAQGVRLTRPDVGGSQMMEQVRMTANGANARHTTMQVDGMVVNSQMADGYIMNYNNQALSQEMAISTSGSPAEVAAGGLRLNMIPQGWRQRPERVALRRLHRWELDGGQLDRRDPGPGAELQSRCQQHL